MDKLQEKAREVAAVNLAEREQLRAMTTPALLRQALLETKLLVKAEILHARREFEEDLRQAKNAGIVLGSGIALALCGLSVAFVGVALALPISKTAAAFIVAGFLILVAAACAAIGYRRLPTKPMQQTQRRLKEDLSISRGQFA